MSKLIKIEDVDNESVSMIWSSIISIRKMPKPFFQLNPISFIKAGSGSIFVLDSDISNFNLSCKKLDSIPEERKKEMINSIANEWIKKYDAAVISNKDLKEINFSSFQNDTIYKIYSIIMSQSSELMNIYFTKKFLSKINFSLFNQINSVVSYREISSDSILSLRKDLFDTNLFKEIGKRIYRKLDEVLLMSPEDIYSSLYGGVFDDELEDRKLNYIIVYDLEKDAPHIYGGEKARAMEANLLNSY